MRCACGAVAALAVVACSGPVASVPTPKENHIVTTPPATHVLPAALEAELVHIRRAPLAAVGPGEKGYLPYELLQGADLARDPDSAIVPRLATEALDPRNDVVFRFVMLQILGLRREAAVDDALVVALADPMLRPLAAYFLGRSGYKGYPQRDRKTTEPLLGALAAHLHDVGVYEDPWWHTRYATADLVLAAFVRIAGPDRFAFVDPSERVFLGYTFRFPDAERAGLLGQAERWRYEAHE